MPLTEGVHWNNEFSIQKGKLSKLPRSLITPTRAGALFAEGQGTKYFSTDEIALREENLQFSMEASQVIENHIISHSADKEPRPGFDTNLVQRKEKKSCACH